MMEKNVENECVFVLFVKWSVGVMWENVLLMEEIEWVMMEMMDRLGVVLE